MISILNRIRRKLSLKLSFGIMLFLIAVFIVSLGILFIRSRQMVRDEAMSRAEHCDACERNDERGGGGHSHCRMAPD